MDFFESQDIARRRTGRLIVLFILAVVLMDAALYAAAVGVLSRFGPENQPIDWWQPIVFLSVTAALLVIIAMGSGLKTYELRSGGRAVAEMLGGRRVPPNTADLPQQRLLNVVEEMALASGMPVPPVYLLETERGINAFAAGYTPGDAVIGINQGTLDHLNRDELQGVVAHEFSHILNGDMRLNLRLVGVLHGIQLLGLIGEFILELVYHSERRSFRRRDKKGDGLGALVAIGFTTYVVGYVGLFFGRMIKSAVSRQREYLADASAVQFTRDSEGIGGALKKIGGHKLGSRVKSPEAEVASHMFFGAALRFSEYSPFATHPPLKARITRIDPRFDGAFPVVEPLAEIPLVAEVVKRPSASKADVVGIPGLGDPSAISAALVLASIGRPTTRHVEKAANLMDLVPGHITAAAHDVYSARAVVFATLLDRDHATRTEQLEMIRRDAGADLANQTVKLYEDFRKLDAASRLPIIQIVQGTLHDLAPSQYREFRTLVQVLIAADRRISLLEFVMQRLVLRRLDRHFGNRKPSRPRYYAAGGLVRDATVLLSMMAYAGHKEDADAAVAFERAMEVFVPKAEQHRPVTILSREECQVPQLHEALKKFEKSTPPVKQILLNAAAVSVATDGDVNIVEAELMRAIADSLDCPIPLP